MSSTPARSRSWPVVTGLLLLTLVPVVAGAFRVTELSSGPAVTPDNARFIASPVPVVAHIISITVYSMLGAFQFVPGLRARRWHRYAGRILAPAGLVVALSGLWMTVFYQRPPGYGLAVTVERFIVAPGMIVAVVLGVLAIRRGNVPVHRAWMMRAYALAMGAGTQAFTAGAWYLAFGSAGEHGVAVYMGAGWLINIAVAEWMIRRRPVVVPPARVAVAVV